MLYFLDILVQTLVKLMFGEGFNIADDDEFHAGTGDGNVHAAQVAQETYLSLLVGTHERDDDDVAFLSLEPVNGVHGDKTAVWLVVFAPADELAQILHLCAIGRYDAHVDAFLKDA